MRLLRSTLLALVGAAVLALPAPAEALRVEVGGGAPARPVFWDHDQVSCVVPVGVTHTDGKRAGGRRDPLVMPPGPCAPARPPVVGCVVPVDVGLPGAVDVCPPAPRRAPEGLIVPAGGGAR
ncbi:hypothetical protein [Nocardioides ferulae]|uniref:hypothetical protein n=1 Tax=Nocardioides ferulae TaxID=2340821 RepID=UPI000EAFC5E5|nr:hypothetical protein [Nocardioides ferulae]